MGIVMSKKEDKTPVVNETSGEISHYLCEDGQKFKLEDLAICQNYCGKTGKSFKVIHVKE